MNKPNIIVILTDDQGCWALGCAGNNEIKTPNLDRLAETGLTFNNFFCASPVCSPARATMLTGKIPSSHGIHDYIHTGDAQRDIDEPLIEFLKDHKGYTDILAQNGYTCGVSGKWHMGDAHHRQKGFSFWHVYLTRGFGNYYNASFLDGATGDIIHDPKDYSTDVITDYALEFLNSNQDKTTPFCLCVNYIAPHSPWERKHHPKKVFDYYYNECSFDSVPNVPSHIWARKDCTPKSPEQRREWLAGYFAATTEMDRNVGRILDWLEQNNSRENTLIFFASDNGMNMGHHGIFGKGNGTFPMNMYDTSVKVPAIISRPGHVPEGKSCDCMLSQYDFFPTILDYIGIDHQIGALPGKSFAPILSGDNYQEAENVVVFDEYGPVRMIRNRDFKYIHRYPYGPHEFYDLKNDPDENKNLYGEKKFSSTITEMKSQMDNWFLKYSDPQVDGSREPVTGYGQINLAGTKGKGQKAFNESRDGCPRYVIKLN